MPELREDMVEQGVRFLQHPSVQSTPMSERVTFMEGKGLTADEIKEVLKRHKAGGAPAAATAPATAAGAQIRRVDPQPRMSAAVVHGGTVTLSGQVADPEGAGAQSVGEQTRAVLAKIDALLAESGSDKSRLLSATVYLTDIAAQYDAFNEEWDAWVPEGAAPARACVQAALAFPQLLVEVSVVAAV